MVYLIATISIHDRDRYQQYEAGFLDIFARFSGALLSVEESPTVLEGEWPVTRTVLVSFPSESDAMAWYRSDDYQALMQHRLAASVGNIALVNALPAT
ncbi:MAG: DUF1330 domain-containing protein [Pseudomonadaceae bacterium]|nr:DUF1330 domain-containing protein [Pseudomonadaceae bacterium]